VHVRKIVILILSVYGFASPALAQNIAGDWIGQMNGAFKVRIHFEKTASGFSGELINPSGNETGMNHLLQDAKTGAPNEYNEIEETMSPAAIKIINVWLSKYAFAPRCKAPG
jgi:hypothetical protein